VSVAAQTVAAPRNVVVSQICVLANLGASIGQGRESARTYKNGRGESAPHSQFVQRVSYDLTTPFAVFVGPLSEKSQCASLCAKSSAWRAPLSALDSLRRSSMSNSPLWDRIDARLADFSNGYRLSTREREVLFGLVRGQCPKTLAIHMECAPSTVVVYCRRIYAKTNSRSRDELMTRVLLLVAANALPATGP
jgi:DNA-binding CsgD family transcriptional regulator